MAKWWEQWPDNQSEGLHGRSKGNDSVENETKESKRTINQIVDEKEEKWRIRKRGRVVNGTQKTRDK